MPKKPGGRSIADDAALVPGKATAGAAIAGDENDPGNLRLEGRAGGKPARIADAGSLVVGAGEVPALDGIDRRSLLQRPTRVVLAFSHI